MLYILNKSTTTALEQLAVIGADDTDKTVLFVLDGVFLTTAQSLINMTQLGIDAFYAEKDAVAARLVKSAEDVELVDYDEIAELLDDADKIVTL